MTRSDPSASFVADPQRVAPAALSDWFESFELRCREERDTAGIYALLTQPGYERNGCTLDPFTCIADMEAFARGSGSPHLEIVAVQGTMIVGFAGLYVSAGRQAHIGSFTLSVHEDYQRRGIGLLLMRGLVGIAFGPMRLARLQATVFADNEPALSLYRRLGFCVEGRLSRFVLRGDGFMDGFLIALTPDGRPDGMAMQ